MTAHLQQKQVLITRHEPKASEFATRITKAGGKAFITPLINVACKVLDEKRKFLQQIEHYEWIIFTSANGVHCFFSALHRFASHMDERVKLATVGPKTNAALTKFGFEADFIPSRYDAKTMSVEFLQNRIVKGPILLVRGQLSGTVLQEVLGKNAVPFDSLEVYETTTNVNIKQRLQVILEKETIDFITFTSPSTVDAFVDLMPDYQCYLDRAVVCIGTTTAKRAKEYGFRHLLVPNEFTTEGMIQKIADYISEGTESYNAK
ncbi:uroporphyrinogen-III synthase [Virgibacillus soli]|uniref:Uroporphyrinogen-III synthase n=1 Tax=Paracerasibacillus soli TaxID=480284 RepID=A0ABU5CMP1_9BACI|nr:uroporphyrinogen-III synthase [Virgibacillus soli]MDY0407638.1 uroporphyrinogen-III synthase [Virgibacillus soli]